jgi:hypothetical protein
MFVPVIYANQLHALAIGYRILFAAAAVVLLLNAGEYTAAIYRRVPVMGMLIAPARVVRRPIGAMPRAAETPSLAPRADRCRAPTIRRAQKIRIANRIFVPWKKYAVIMVRADGIVARRTAPTGQING